MARLLDRTWIGTVRGGATRDIRHTVSDVMCVCMRVCWVWVWVWVWCVCITCTICLCHTITRDLRWWTADVHAYPTSMGTSIAHDTMHLHATRCISFLDACQHPTGGFGGGPGQVRRRRSYHGCVHAELLMPMCVCMMTSHLMFLFRLRISPPRMQASLHCSNL